MRLWAVCIVGAQQVPPLLGSQLLNSCLCPLLLQAEAFGEDLEAGPTAL